ncbi:AAA family ATPase [Gimesia algae]|uniref:AAA family ATPase n=1 Tax=Gimesia algae TaxID=2527971 RepID=UPI0036F44839
MNFYKAYLKTLTGIVHQLKGADQKVQLIYAFNGTGKTRLSREFKQLISPKNDVDETVLSRDKILYYNAFTEDLFYWDNDLTLDAEPKLKIQPNSFTDWILVDQGQDQNVIANFQRYTSDKLTPRFHSESRERHQNGKKIVVQSIVEVTFSIETGDNVDSGNLKLSKGEESNFIWSVFYTLLEQVVSILNVPEPDERETNVFDKLEYIFIDDPVSSLDDNHVIELAVDLAELIRLNESSVKFIISTHNPVFYNVLCNELVSDDKSRRPYWRGKWFGKSRLERSEEGGYLLVPQPNDSPFSYHLHLLAKLKAVIDSGQVEKYHFSLLRNILEKTATFLGHKRWEHLLPSSEDGRPNPYAKRILNFSSHSKHSAEEVPDLEPQDQKVLKQLIDHIVSTHRFWQEQESDD